MTSAHSRKLQIFAYLAVVLAAMVGVATYDDYKRGKQGDRITKIERIVEGNGPRGKTGKAGEGKTRVIQRVIVRRVVTQRVIRNVPVPGPRGPRGFTGARGATGAQGPIGRTGPMGPVGPLQLLTPGAINQVVNEVLNQLPATPQINIEQITQQILTQVCARLQVKC